MAWVKWTFAENKALKDKKLDFELVSNIIDLVNRIYDQSPFYDIDQDLKSKKRNHHKNELCKESIKALFENCQLYISKAAYSKTRRSKLNNLVFNADGSIKLTPALLNNYIPNLLPSSLRWEHVVPAAVMLAAYQDKQTKENFNYLKSNFGHVCIVTKEEDCRLTKLGLNDKMPDNRSLAVSKVWDRYLAAKIEVMEVSETQLTSNSTDNLICKKCLSKDKKNQYKCKLIKGDIQSNDPMPCLNNKKVEE